MGHVCLWLSLTAFALAFGCGKGSEQPAAGGDDPVSRGRKLYAANGCNVCHGSEGRGDGPVSRSLNPKPRDFSDRSGYRRGPGLAEIEETIEKGLHTNQGVMPAFPSIQPEDRRHLALFIQSLQSK